MSRFLVPFLLALAIGCGGAHNSRTQSLLTSEIQRVDLQILSRRNTLINQLENYGLYSESERDATRTEIDRLVERRADLLIRLEETR